jgi:replicative DNA helicase
MSELYNDADFIELVIKCLFREKTVLSKALDLQIKPEDFGTINIYNAFVDVALAIGEAPINPQLCLAQIKTVLKKYNISESDKSTVLTFWEAIYDDSSPVNAGYIASNLPEFIKFRRFQTLKTNNINSPEVLVSEAKRLIGDIDLKSSTEGIRQFNPFQELVTVEHKESLLTGFLAVDQVARGLNYQEFGIILGHSGSGKTATGVYSAIQNAKQRRKVLYLSLEEPGENICNRIYSNIHRIPYTGLHKGDAFAKQDLRSANANMSEQDRKDLQNLLVHDLRDATPLTASYIADYLDKLYEETGYHPDLVYIDQMDYLTTKDKFDAEWQKYSKVAFEVDALCDHLIGGQHKFSVWLLHQASGKMARKFTNAEISGFKGILKPADMVLAIGRDTAQESIVSIFSLKSRHAKNFQFDYLAELEFMNFEHQDRASEERAKEDKKDRKQMSRSNFENIPPSKVQLLPAAGTGFK